MVAAYQQRTARATVAALKRRAAASDSGEAELVRLLEHQLQRALEQIAALEARNQALERENDVLTTRISHLRSPRTQDGKLLLDGREVVNQSEAARRLGVKQYAISRWVAAGHFQTARVGARQMIFADSLHTPAKKSRKKKGQ